MFIILQSVVVHIIHFHVLYCKKNCAIWEILNKMVEVQERQKFGKLTATQLQELFNKFSPCPPFNLIQ